MKIQLLSDLHNEVYRLEAIPEITQTDAEVIVLAGDIGVGLRGLRWAGKEAERLGKPVLYVSGNHEFYHHDIALMDEMRTFAAEHELLHLLENDELIIGDVRFLGCTLWTDYRSTGDPQFSMTEAQRYLNDHHVVTKGENLFLPEDAYKLHMTSRGWLEKKLSQPFAGKTVVVTHHAPHLLCTHPSFPMNPIGAAFLSDLSRLVEMADMWCFGHTHSNLDVRVGKCRLVSNQRGYSDEGVKGYDPEGVLAI